MRILDCYTKHVLVLLAITHCRIASPHQYRTKHREGNKTKSMCNLQCLFWCLVVAVEKWLWSKGHCDLSCDTDSKRVERRESEWKSVFYFKRLAHTYIIIISVVVRYRMYVFMCTFSVNSAVYAQSCVSELCNVKKRGSVYIYRRWYACIKSIKAFWVYLDELVLLPCKGFIDPFLARQKLSKLFYYIFCWNESLEFIMPWYSYGKLWYKTLELKKSPSAASLM